MKKKLYISIIFVTTAIVTISLLLKNNEVIYSLFTQNEANLYIYPQENTFKVPEIDSLFITTSKRNNGQFYVFFSKDSSKKALDFQNYIKFKTDNNGDINLVFNPDNSFTVFLRESDYLDSVKVLNFNLKILHRDEFNSMFYKPRYKTNPLILKYPFIEVDIITMSNLIIINKYSIIQERINSTHSNNY